MPRVDIHMDTDLRPDVIRNALLDFTDRRTQLWPGITPSFYEVFEVNETTADIREGTKGPGGGFWAVEHYDWSDPETVKWTVRESNFCKPGSWVSATITAKPGGGSHIHVIWNRTPSTFLGRIATLLIRLTRGAPVARSMKMGLDAIRREQNAVSAGMQST